MQWPILYLHELIDKLIEEVNIHLTTSDQLDEADCRLLAYRLQNAATILQLSTSLPGRLIEIRKLLRYLHNVGAQKEGVTTFMHPNAVPIAQAGREFLASSRGISACVKCLQSRRNLDPHDISTRLPLTLILRLQANQIVLDDYHILINEPLLSEKPKRPTPWCMPLHDALQIITDTLPTFQAEKVRTMYKQNRIRLLSETDSVGNCCVIVENNAFIQIVENKAGVNVLSLAHELGHALQLESMPVKQHASLTTLSKEVAAITMEKALLHNLMDVVPGRAAWADNYQNYLRYWYLDWHRLVHEFELNLYQNSKVNRHDLNDAWQCYLQAPPEWQKIQHLYTAPFSCILYAFAYKMINIISNKKNIK